MDEFYIEFTDKFALTEGGTSRLGVIKILDFVEYFRASLSYWTAEQYERQWQEGLQRLCSGAKSSCLVTDRIDPKHSTYIFWWLMYREDEWVYFQNEIFFLSELEEPFQEERLYSYVGKREVLSEDGGRISEWKIKLEDVSAFMSLLEGLR